MKILLVHNKYKVYGGEDTMYFAEKKVLERKNHKIISYLRDNAEIDRYNLVKKIIFPFSLLFSFRTYKDISDILKNERPDVVYVHNDFPLISPSVYLACNKYKVPVIKRVPNYRFFCSNGFFLRDKKICELCLRNNNPFIGVKYNCYRNSKILTFLVAFMLKAHRRTYKSKIRYVLPNSEIVKDKLLQGGFDRKRIVVKNNFTSGGITPLFKKEKFAIYVGRLSEEKGVKTMIAAWKDIKYPLEIYGEGYKDLVLNNNNIRLKGSKSNKECLKRIKKASFLIFPSEWEETFGISMIEAFSVGTPVLASRMGNMKYVVEEGKTGKFFNPGNSNDLREKALWMISHSKECEAMGRNAYKEYLEKYTPEVNYNNLMKIFKRAIKDAKNR